MAKAKDIMNQRKQFILLHGSSVEQNKVDVVVKAISRTCKLLDSSNKTYLFEGDKNIAKEVIDGMIGEFSITPLKEYKLADTKTVSNLDERSS